MLCLVQLIFHFQDLLFDIHRKLLHLREPFAKENPKLNYTLTQQYVRTDFGEKRETYTFIDFGNSKEDVDRLGVVDRMKELHIRRREGRRQQFRYVIRFKRSTVCQQNQEIDRNGWNEAHRG